MTGNILRLMLSRGLSMVRWNNFPRVVDVTQMDNVWATLHTALFLVSLEKQEYDSLYIIKKIIFSSFSDFVLSDINSGTKNTIKKLDSEMYDAVYWKAYKYFLKYEMPDCLKNDYENVMFWGEKEREDEIIYAAKKYVGYQEALPNARVFPEMYEIYMQEMREELDRISHTVSSLKILQNTKKYQSYLSHIFRLSVAMRWNQYARQVPISVMSHSVIVAYISYIIAMIENTHGAKNDIWELMMRAIYHDVPEVITWDIISPTKKAVPWFSELLEKVEAHMLDEYFFGYIDTEYKNTLKPYLLEPFLWEVWKKVKYADIFSAYLEAKIEAPHSQVFRLKEQKIRKEIQKMQGEWVEYLLREVLFEFEVSEDDSLN